MDGRHSMKRFALGVVILIVGGGLLLKNLGFISDDITKYFLRWELIVLFIGIGMLLHREKRIFGFIVFIIGGIFYLKFLGSRDILPDFFDFDINFWQIFWPSILILAGILIIFKRSIDCKHELTGVSEEDQIDEVAFFGGGDRIINTQSFRGGKITAIFGGSNFNLARARLAEGKNYLDVFAVFGGMKLIVPEDWDIKIKVSAVFGGFSDKHRIVNIDEKAKDKAELIIKGFVLFGGGEIRSF